MKRILFLTGYYGSGKSEVAVNLAIQKHVDTVVDLDVINPYFRSRETEVLLKENGIRVISSDLENGMYSDMPYISGKVFQPFLNHESHAIYDLGGNDLGAKLLIQFADYDEEIDLYLVVNVYRMETQTAKQIVELIEKIEVMGERKVTGLVNNSNLLRETTLEDILSSQAILDDASKITGLPIVYTTIKSDLYHKDLKLRGEIIPLAMIFRKKWY